MNSEPRARRTGSGRLPGEQTRARAMHRISTQSTQSSQSSALDPKLMEGFVEKRRRKSQTEGGAPFRGKPATSPRENPRIGKIPMVPTVPAVAACVATSRKPVLEARFSPDLPSGNSGNCQQSPRSPRSPRGVGGLPGVPGMATGSRRPERLGSKEGKEGREWKERKEPTSDVQKRALVLLASSKSAAVKERTETFIQKHKIALPLGGTTADEPNESGAKEPRELCDTQLPQPDPTDEKGTLPSSGAAEPAESTAQSWCAPLDALTFAWLQGTFQWCIQCMIGCVLLSLRCCFGSINCLKPILVEEAPRRRYQDKVAVRTRPDTARPRRRGAGKAPKDSLSEQLDTLEALLSHEAASLVSLKAEKI